MGCFGSREDARRDAYVSNFNGVEYGFNTANSKSLSGFCPLDKIAIAYCGGTGKELTDAFGDGFPEKAELPEDKTKEIGAKIFNALKDLHKFLAGKGDDKVFGKYAASEAAKEIDAVLTKFCEKSGLEHKWPEVATAPDDMMKDMGMDGEAAADDMMMAEGGEEKAEGMAAPEKKIADDAFGDISGATNLPHLLLSLMFIHPVFGDVVKSQVLNADLTSEGGFMPKISIPIPGMGGLEADSFAAVATMTAAYVNA